MKPCCISIDKGMGILCFISIVLGVGLIGVSVLESMTALSSNVDVAVTKLKAQIAIRVDYEGGLTGKKFINIRDIEQEDFIRDFLPTIKPVWVGAAFAGIICGVLQFFISIWLIINLRISAEISFQNSKWWIRLHLVESLILLTTFGALFIEGFFPETLGYCFAVDFILINICACTSILIIRGNSEPNPNKVLSGPLWDTIMF